MKKAYSKPMITFESFTLSTNIAAGCEVKTSLLGKGACGYSTKLGVVFTSLVDDCRITEGVDTTNESYNDICYHVPSETYNLFNS